MGFIFLSCTSSRGVSINVAVYKLDVSFAVYYVNYDIFRRFYDYIKRAIRRLI